MVSGIGLWFSAFLYNLRGKPLMSSACLALSETRCALAIEIIPHARLWDGGFNHTPQRLSRAFVAQRRTHEMWEKGRRRIPYLARQRARLVTGPWLC